ncbi:MAG: SPFH domain-containing protein, partial [Planctomycetota bacterium]
SDIALNALRSNVGTMKLDEVLAERQSLNERIASELSDTARKWGIQFTRVEIQEIQTSEDTSRAMRQQMDAERKRRAIVAEAEGSAEAELRLAEAQKQAAILRAEGVAEALQIAAEAESNYLQRLSEKIGSEQAAAVLVAQRYISGFEVISKNPADKVYLPNSFNAVFNLPAESKSTGE